jgi:hypothetical protein
MKKILSITFATTLIFVAITILQQYHDGAAQATRDYKIANDLNVDQHECTASDLYCNGYSRGYNDQADFLG